MPRFCRDPIVSDHPSPNLWATDNLTFKRCHTVCPDSCAVIVIFRKNVSLTRASLPTSRYHYLIFPMWQHVAVGGATRDTLQTNIHFRSFHHDGFLGEAASDGIRFAEKLRWGNGFGATRNWVSREQISSEKIRAFECPNAIELPIFNSSLIVILLYENYM